MFRQFRVQNFMCLKDVSVELEPLTIFVGPNSSGKSALFRALTCFSRLLWVPVRGGKYGEFTLEGGTTLDEVVWNGDSSYPIIFEVWFRDSESSDPDYTLELRRDYTGWRVTREKFTCRGTPLDTAQGFTVETSTGAKNLAAPFNAPLAFLLHRFTQDPVAAPHIEPIQQLRARLGETRRYRPSASDVAAFVRPPSPSEARGKARETAVGEAGRGVPLALRDLLTTDRPRFEQIEAGLQQYHNHIRGITFRSDWRGVGLFYRTPRAAQELPANLESDGVLLTTFLLWRLYTAPPNLKLCLEEPENGVHLWAMKERYELLKEYVTNQSERNVQVLVATHSRDFLNSIASRNEIIEQVRVVECDGGSGTAVYPLTHYRQINELLDECRNQMGDLGWSKRLEGRFTPSG